MTPNFNPSYNDIDIHDFQGMSDRFPSFRNMSMEDMTIALELTKSSIEVASLVEKVKALERIPRGADGRRENVAEHSFMVALLAREAARILKLDVDSSKLLSYALCHDLLEIETGDTNTFSLTAEELEEKENREQAALTTLLEQLPQELASDLRAYEEGVDIEARLVRAVDKLAPIAINIAGGNMEVLRADLEAINPKENNLSFFHDELNDRYSKKFGDEFPGIVAAHGLGAVILEKRVKEDLANILAIELQRNPTEVERKFLVDLGVLSTEIDLNSPEVEKKHFRQFYIKPKEDEGEVRLRSIDGVQFQQTIKSSGTIERKENTTDIRTMTPEGFVAVYKGIGIGNIISKTRHYIPIENGRKVELDIYEDQLNGLVIAEVEFKGRDALQKAVTWKPKQSWLQNEVTDNSRFKNKNIAFIDDVSKLLSEA